MTISAIKNKLFIVPLCLAAMVQAQSPRAYEQAATVAFESSDYYAAFKYYGKALELDPKRIDIMVRYADAARLYGAFKEAEKQYEKALDYDNAAGGKYHTALFGLALVKKDLGKYDEALQLFERYATRPDSDPELSKKAAAEINECEWAMEKLTNPDKLVQLTPLDDRFNTDDSEMGVTQLGEDTLFFGAMRSVNWGDKHTPARPLLQVMMSVKGQKVIPAIFSNPKKHTALPSFSPDGKIMIIPYGEYVGETEVRCHLYFSKKQQDNWSVPVPLPASVNITDATQTQPNIAKEHDGYYTLFYISDASIGKGGKDIWKIRFSAAGNFAQPENLGYLNTNADEATPYFDAANSTLYFSSTGYQNLGGYDIYKSKLVKNVWQSVKHLPNPINSSYNDLFYVPANSKQAIMTSNRLGMGESGEESCCYDLFNVSFLDLKLNAAAFEENTIFALDEVIYTLLEDQKEPVLQYAPDAKHVNFNINRDQRYRVIASKDGFISDTISISSLDLEPSKTELSSKLYLTPMPVDLAVKVFNQISKEPLYNVKISLYERVGSVKEEKNTGLSVNESSLKADYKRSYTIIASKEGFASDTIRVSAFEMSKPGTKVIKNLFLTPATLSGILPLSIYFDNDVPPKSYNPNESYTFNYQAYMARKEAFIRIITKDLPNPSDQQAATDRLTQFFDQEVKGGYFKLEQFAEHLDLFLNNNYEVEILVKAFASPLASSDYNLALTRRRIVSVKNYLRTAKGGIYASFILNNQLKISTAPLGESEAQFGVSDNQRQLSQSVYSVEASKERRAEIIEVRLTRINK